MRKRHTYEDRLKYMKMLEEGYSLRYIADHTGVCKHLLKELWIKYQQDGPTGLTKKSRVRTDGYFRETVLRDIEKNYLTLEEAAVKYNISSNVICKWRRIVRLYGYDALYESKKNGRPPRDMGRPRKKKVEDMTELERLRYENERLRAENALLKKVRALVEEREARLRETGRKPSKN